MDKHHRHVQKDVVGGSGEGHGGHLLNGASEPPGAATLTVGDGGNGAGPARRPLTPDNLKTVRKLSNAQATSCLRVRVNVFLTLMFVNSDCVTRRL